MNNNFSITIPEDLEREIFELAANTSPSCRITLACVSKKVNCWVLPKLYRSLLFSHQEIFSYPDTFSRYGHYTQDIVFDVPYGEMGLTQCLPYFPCVQSLFFSKAYLGDAFLRAARNYPCLKELWVYLSVDLNVTNYGSKSFVNLTHLALFKSVRSWNEVEAIQYFPVLSHILFVDPDEVVLVRTLASCHRLELVLAAKPTPQEVVKQARRYRKKEWKVEFLAQTYGQVQDIRLVAFWLVGWTNLLNRWGTSRLWSGGEDVVAARAAGR
ncbi:hypothetical protein BDN72DRAFT_903739 [Pluteus cervinus]|uniref:Uncharacterized protein n=1 Tax=Pluteus cervinus TaxID=181527 RepID=A0ACD3A8X6_9AGAR|nr:hypothetical protein BDN72DRAFT_903739 [Pluteus cervinus]